MIYEYISLVIGMIKILIYKLIYWNRIKFKFIPKFNMSFRIAIKKGAKIILNKNFRVRNEVSFRIYDKGTVKIGNDCFFNDGCSINCQKNIEIGDNVIFGQNVMLFDHDHDYRNNMDNFIKEDIKIGNNVWIGANCIILKGVTIGDDVVVAAGTVVKDNIVDNALVYQKKENIIKKRIL